MAIIFVVDDDSNYRAMLHTLLEDKGHVVAEAFNGADVLKNVERMKRPPSLFIVDLKMPGVGGYELIRELRQHERTKSTPVLMLTASGDGVRDLAEREGVVFLRKVSTTNDEILSYVDCLLRGAPLPKPKAPAQPKPIDDKSKT